jgi:hypothetical protein
LKNHIPPKAGEQVTVSPPDKLVPGDLLPRYDGEPEPVEDFPKSPLMSEFRSYALRISDDVPPEFPTHFFNPLGALVDEQMNPSPETVDVVLNTGIIQEKRRVNRILQRYLFIWMIPLEAEDAAIPSNVIEIPRVLIGNDPIVAKEKGGHNPHETGNTHPEEQVRPFSDQSYELVELLFHGERKMEGLQALI